MPPVPSTLFPTVVQTFRMRVGTAAQRVVNGSIVAVLAVGCAPEVNAGRFVFGIDIAGIEAERTVSELLVSWERAKSRCESLADGGLTDWRLPSVLEVEAILGEGLGEVQVEEPDSKWIYRGVWTCNPVVSDNQGYWYYSPAWKRLSYFRFPHAGTSLCVRGRRADCTPIRDLPFLYITVADPDARSPVPGARVEAAMREPGSIVSLGTTDRRGIVRVKRHSLEGIAYLVACKDSRCGVLSRESLAGVDVSILLPSRKGLRL
jgi:hypothetical protein